ncbi:Hypothetical protein, putative [Bodo saltans]|uniref:Cyclic nucleotide-binding domain-containing protein n=1 Tax=Bodo saltans TaxID=75058 RepID=A0A0S4JG45_BODSA|nr:Hypothetical protein, putative [Bodo saltans]|eukprot:CUG89107.1 Hypothetical protein, putative [Bodo saltans]
MSAASSPRLPTQNELFAYFMLLCGHHRIKKPPRVIAALLDEDETSRSDRLTREANDLRVTPSQVVEAQQDTQVSVQLRSSVVALSSRTVVPMIEVARAHQLVAPSESKVHIGNRGVVVWLMLIAQCPLLEEIDLSVVTSLYAADAYRTNVSGNHVIDVLCEVVEQHPSVSKIDLRGHPLGTVPGRRILTAIQNNRRIVNVSIDEEGVDRLVVQQLKTELGRNAASAHLLPSPSIPSALSSELESLQWVDRKTSRERQTLRNVLSEVKAFQSCSDDDIDRLVSHAERISLEQVVKDSAGLRGDREHLFVLESGSIEVSISNTPFSLARGDYFGYTYHTAMFSAGVIAEKERGYAFRIPLDVCAALVQVWESSVDRYLPLLRESIVLQGAHVWMLMRACHTATLIEGAASPQHADASAANDVKVLLQDLLSFTPRGKPFVGLFVVVDGQYEVIAAPEYKNGEKVLSSPRRHQFRSETQTRNEGALMTTRSMNLLDQYKASEERKIAEKQLASIGGGGGGGGEVAQSTGSSRKLAADAGGYTFSRGDVFGEEPLTIKRITGYVTGIQPIVAHSTSTGATPPPRCVLLDPEGSTAVVQCLKQTMRMTTRLYTQALE